MLFDVFTKSTRRFLIGEDQKFIFERVDVEKLKFPKIEEIGLYIHIPFCKSLCPYCPYNRILYKKELIFPFVESILKEIDMYYEKFGGVKISSIYIGGGTPTNLIDEIGIILKSIREKFIVNGDICIETNISEINESVIEKLKKYGIERISIGVQSFNNKCLKLLGRNYKAENIIPALKLSTKANFKSTNIDLMFALPGQNIDDVLADLKKAVESNVNQITVYPLFSFPYSSVGQYKKLKRIKMPNFFTRRKMYYKIYDFLIQNGYKRVSVWGFVKGDAPRYSSVTRNYYIGLGPGAATSFSNMFYFNTFNVEKYISAISENRLPISIKMDVSDRLADFYWFYWKLYDTYFSREQIKEVFGEARGIYRLIRTFKLFRLVKESEGRFELTKSGAFWIHLAQNYFMLDYINKVWIVSMKEAWPKRIEI